MSSRAATASRGRSTHLSLQLLLPHVVIAGDCEREVRVARQVLSGAGYAVTVAAAGKLAVPELQRRIEAILRSRTTDLLVVTDQDPLRPAAGLIERIRERYIDLPVIAIAPLVFNPMRERRGPDAFIRSPIDAAELRRAARRLAPALPELASKVFT